MFILVDKPLGVTSFSITKHFSKLLQKKGLGHFGTLDPAASGLLILSTEPKFFNYFNSSFDEKVYGFVIKFGIKTDTADLEGEVIERNSIYPTAQALEAILEKFTGQIEQTPPKFSALKVDGKRAYDLARKGVEFEMKPRKVSIFSLKFFETASKMNDAGCFQAAFLVRCSSGTYIRTLAEDIAESVGAIGTVSLLRRYSIGTFSFNDFFNEAVMHEDIQKAFLNDINKTEQTFELHSELHYKTVDFKVFSQMYPVINLKQEALEKLYHGQSLDAKTFNIEKSSEKNLDAEIYCAMFNNQFAGLVKLEGDTIFVLRMVKK